LKTAATITSTVTNFNFKNKDKDTTGNEVTFDIGTSNLVTKLALGFKETMVYEITLATSFVKSD
jgi:hypothetical protein